MAEFTSIANQNVLPQLPVIFTENTVPCGRGLIFRRDGSGLFRLASVASYQPYYMNCGCGCFNMPETMYLVSFHANIAVPTGGTVEPISLALAIDGEVDPATTMIFTPAAVEEYGNVGTEALIGIPAICGCGSLSVRNTSNQAIDIQNANLVIDYRGVKY